MAELEKMVKKELHIEKGVASYIWCFMGRKFKISGFICCILIIISIVLSITNAPFLVGGLGSGNIQLNL
jgi:hypothetical protein